MADAADYRIIQLHQDCQDLVRYITRTRSEIAALRPVHLKTEKLPRAGQELDAVVKETEEATHEIMASAEGLMAWTGSAAELSPAIEAACMRIFEACAFQDITGQRVRKVVQTIHHVEERLEQLIRLLGGDSGEEEEDRRTGDAALLNGPQLAGLGNDQNSVDAMFGDGVPSAKQSGEPDDAVEKMFKRSVAAEAAIAAAPAPKKPAGNSAQDAIDSLFD